MNANLILASKMSNKLSSFLSIAARNIPKRQFSLETCKYARGDAITVDPFKDVEDVETHTGQKYEIGDPRRLRFMNATKYVNPNIAMDLIAQVPPIASKDRIVWCDGGDEHLGHPKVYINLDKPGNHTCGYCGLRFIKDDSHHH